MKPLYKEKMQSTPTFIPLIHSNIVGGRENLSACCPISFLYTERKVFLKINTGGLFPARVLKT